MPRRNNTPRHKPYQPSGSSEQAKVRYRTRQQAEQAIAESQKYNLDVSLSAYKSPHDGYWYLTSN